MTVAERTREAVRANPFLHDALRAGVVNYTAAARFLGLDADTEAVAAALRRYAESRAYQPPEGDARVRMESGVGPVDAGCASEASPDAEPLLAVGGTVLAADGGSLTAVLATGEVGPATLRDALGRCSAAGVAVEAAAVAGDALAVVVPRREGPEALRRVEAAV